MTRLRPGGRAAPGARLRLLSPVVAALLGTAVPLLSPPAGAASGRSPAEEAEDEEVEIVEEEITPLGFSRAGWERQRALEGRLASLLKPTRIARTLRRLTARPHRAGTADSERVARWILSEAERAGLEAEIVPYLFYNSHPGPRSIRLTAPVERALSLEEDRIEEDPFARAPWKHRAFCAYSGSGTAEGEVVYVGQGTVEDFGALDESAISLEGRVALMRYFGEEEGTKVLRARERGAVAVVLYADPLEDGFVHGEVYPKGNWRPPGGIMRRSVIATPYDGDPLSPGWAATPGARRLEPGEIEGLPRIPVLPISYRAAAVVLSHLGGPRAPDRMQGAIVRGDGGARPLEYRLGPGPARLRLSVQMDERTDTILDVIVRVPGEAEPEAWVILGTHHDAWIYGAGDPSSGTAADLEIVRALGDLRREGWRPRRTIVLAFWDAEEMNLGGSAEWVEEHAEQLREKGVAAINMDSAVFNGERPLYVAASPALHTLFREAADVVPAPAAEGSLWASWLRMQNEARGQGSVDGHGPDYDPSEPFERPYIDPIPLGDDQTPFVVRAGLPGSDMYYGADYGMYHSLYEDYHWMTTIVDPNFAHHWVMALLHGVLGLRLAMAEVLPLDPEVSAAAWEDALADLEGRAAALGVDAGIFGPVREALVRFSDAARTFGERRDSVLHEARWEAGAHPDALTAVNAGVAAAARAFYLEDGLPDHPYDRGLWVAPSRAVPGLRDARLPGLRWALELGREGELPRQVEIYARALDEAARQLTGAAELVAGLPREAQASEPAPAEAGDPGARPATPGGRPAAPPEAAGEPERGSATRSSGD
ncbi:MAG: M28 family peptidase [Acidobacteriota bacterium]